MPDIQWYIIATGDFATRFVVPFLTALLTTLVTNGIRTRRERHNTLNGDLIARLRNVKAEAQHITDLVRNHLCGKWETTPKDSKEEVLRRVKSLYAEIKQMRRFFDETEYHGLEKALFEWNTAQTDSPFPIQFKNASLKADDPRLSLRQEALHRFTSLISDIQLDFLAEKRKVKIR